MYVDNKQYMAYGDKDNGTLRSSCKKSRPTSKTSLKTKRRSSTTSGHEKSRNVSSSLSNREIESLSRGNRRRKYLQRIKLMKKRKRHLKKRRKIFLKKLLNRGNKSRKTHIRISCSNTDRPLFWMRAFLKILLKALIKKKLSIQG